MMKRYTLLSVLLGFIVTMASAQNFEKRFGEQNCYFEGRSTAELANGNMIVSGAYNCQGGLQHWNSLLVKLNSKGDTIWTKKNLSPNGLVKTTDDQHLIFLGGNKASFVYDTIKVTKATPNGQVVWQKSFNFGPCGNNTAYDIEQTRDGGFIFTGIYGHQNCNSPDFNSFVVKLDQSGNVEWRKTYGMSSGDDQIFQIEALKSGYAMLGWTTNYGAEGADYWLTRLDPAGSMLWTEVHGGQGDQFGYGLEHTFDGGFLITGQSNHMEAVKTDNWGKQKWTTQYQQACGGQYFRVKQLRDGGFAMLGSQTVNGNCKSALIRTSKYGQVSWKKYWNGRLRNLQLQNDGGFLLTGYVSYLPDMYAIKFDTLRSAHNPSDPNQPDSTLHPYPSEPYDQQEATLKDDSLPFQGSHMFHDHGEPVDQPVNEQDQQGVTTGTEEEPFNKVKQSSMIYPNPAKDIATLQFPNPKAQQYTLRLYNMQGELMRTISNISSHEVKIRQLNLSKGNYIYKLKGPTGDLYMGKLIFQ